MTARLPTPEEHREWERTVSQAELDHMDEEYRRWAGESEHDAAVRDTNHVVELQSRSYTDDKTRYVVQVWNGRRWAKVRGPEGGPWLTRGRAERIARGREESERHSSSTEGMPHRVVEVQA